VFHICSRAFINDTPVAFDPERAMAELVLHTHYLPRHWRGRAHSAEVQQSVNSMFTLKVCRPALLQEACRPATGLQSSLRLLTNNSSHSHRCASLRIVCIAMPIATAG
jgi:hypothetical protein